MDAPKVAPGWYPAPGEPGFTRYWDGVTWGDDRRPVAPTVTPEPSGPSGGVIAAFVISVVALLASFVGVGFLLGLVAMVVLGFTKRRPGRVPWAVATFLIALVAIVIGLVVTFGHRA